ncbi:MAG: type II toxin-antitoxin system VapC family toxin [Verrucomicrobiota bacterium]
MESSFSGDSFITIVTIEEVMRGWLAVVKRARDSKSEIFSYDQLHQLVTEVPKKWEILQWDEDCAEIFSELRSNGVRIGTMDLKIASIAMAHEATLISKNLKDFNQVPGLDVRDCG